MKTTFLTAILISLATPALARIDQCPSIKPQAIAALVCAPQPGQPAAAKITLDIFEQVGCRYPGRFLVTYRNASPVMPLRPKPFDGDDTGLVNSPNRNLPPNVLSGFFRNSLDVEEYLQISTGLLLGTLREGTLREAHAGASMRIALWTCRRL